MSQMHMPSAAVSVLMIPPAQTSLSHKSTTRWLAVALPVAPQPQLRTALAAFPVVPCLLPCFSPHNGSHFYDRDQARNLSAIPSSSLPDPPHPTSQPVLSILPHSGFSHSGSHSPPEPTGLSPGSLSCPLFLTGRWAPEQPPFGSHDNSADVPPNGKLLVKPGHWVLRSLPRPIR